MSGFENVQLFTTTIHFSLLEFCRSISQRWSQISVVVVDVAAAVAAAVAGAVTTLVDVAAAVVAIVIVTKHAVLLDVLLLATIWDVSTI